jgi:putative addiction module component (TIGR02574 family)
MKADLQKVLDEASKLTEAERLRLAERLLSTIDGEPDTDAAAAWAAEIERRTKQIERGEVEPVPWSEVRASLPRGKRGQS